MPDGTKGVVAGKMKGRHKLYASVGKRYRAFSKAYQAKYGDSRNKPMLNDKAKNNADSLKELPAGELL